MKRQYNIGKNIKMIENGGNDLKYALLLKEIKSEIDEALKEVSAEKSKQWGVDVRFYADRFLECTLNKILHYKVNKLCEGCIESEACKYFEQIRRLFFRYGYVVFPYVSYIGRIHNKGLVREKLKSFGAKVKNVLFIASFCFMPEYQDNLEYSALNNALHELLKTLPADYIRKHMMPYIPMDDFIRFASETNLSKKLLLIYSKKELIPKNEAIIRYICNNEETKCLIEALINEDDSFQPPDKFRGLYKAMGVVMKKLEIKR